MNRKTTGSSRPTSLVRLRRVLGRESPSYPTINRRPYLGIIWPAGEHRCRIGLAISCLGWSRAHGSFFGRFKVQIYRIQGFSISTERVGHQLLQMEGEVSHVRSCSWGGFFISTCTAKSDRGQTLRLLAEKWRGGRYQCGTGGLRRLSSGLGALVGASTIRSL
jgi:hypothetical protein